ncbi:carbohydrate ABC transporter permease [Galbitalea soli]|uniref:Sugar ABC transporter permease n=1 Tax=Galbitalea soli TaxID=1268042 RepID=A0A7C9TQB1_9MICO|nr:sugar ABC transporter permease [Galbitalea soli]NEM90163.1 sugar ABC transporter permease [Galbitalea soli]NYJ30871.1 multiple sugar transport system permease protein [Galbitalea soli]
MLAPAILVLAAVSVIPFVSLIVMSFSHVRLLGGVTLTPAGLENWTTVFGDPATWASWLRTLEFFVLAVGSEMALGFGVALILNALRRSRTIVFSITLLPMFLAPITVGLLGNFLLDPTIGLYSWLLRSVGLLAPNHGLLGQRETSMVAIAALDAWEWTPLIALIILAGLTSINPSVLEAASLDGAGFTRTITSVVLPSIAPILLVALLVRSMDAIRYFDIVQITTGGGPASSTWMISQQLQQKVQATSLDGVTTLIGQASVIGITMIAFSTIIANLFVRLLSKRERDR